MKSGIPHHAYFALRARERVNQVEDEHSKV